MIENTIKVYEEDLEGVRKWCDDLYNELFAERFQIVRDLAKRMESKTHTITDEELTQIITELPTELFMAAESLNQLRLDYEVIKLTNKQIKLEISMGVDEEVPRKFQKDALQNAMSDYEIVPVAYSKVIQRVENEMTYAKELIMGAKKVYDSRKTAEQSNPISEIDLPEYEQVYIK